MTGHPAGLRPAAPARVRAALAATARLGMFFRLANPADDPAGWRPVRLLYSAGTELDDLLGAARRNLRDCEPRVAASLFFQGYAARLLSPQLGCLVRAGCVPDMSPDLLHWRQPADSVIELGRTAGPGWRGPAGALVAQLVSTTFEHHLEPLADAIRTRQRVAPEILQDNAAAALISGLRLLGGEPGDDWGPLAAIALTQPRLLGSGTLLAAAPFFIRRSCCLYYRAPGDGSAGTRRMCADCPLAHIDRKNALAIGPALLAPKPPPSTSTAKARSPR